LKPHIDEAVADGYKDARLQAAVQTHLDVKKFQRRCPYTWNDIIDRDIPWPPTD
jgi:hypothetical protein